MTCSPLKDTSSNLNHSLNVLSTLSARNVRYHYRNKRGVKRGKRGVTHLNLNIESGVICGLFGDNGAGKSTAFKLLSGVLRPQAGQIYLNGQEVTHTPLWRRARAGLGYLGQNGALFDDLTVSYNIECGFKSYLQRSSNMKKTLKDLTSLKFVSNRHISHFEEVDQLLFDLGLSHLKHHQIKQLSGGERRRVELARLLAMKPVILLLDEPLAGLDSQAISMMCELILTLKRRGVSVLLSDHQVQRARILCDQIYFMDKGILKLEKI